MAIAASPRSRPAGWNTDQPASNLGASEPSPPAWFRPTPPRSAVMRIRLPGVLALVAAIVLADRIAVAQDLFPDKNLEAVVRQYVFEKRNNAEPLTEKDVETISFIRGKNKGITNLT